MSISLFYFKVHKSNFNYFKQIVLTLLDLTIKDLTLSDLTIRDLTLSDFTVRGNLYRNFKFFLANFTKRGMNTLYRNCS